ncbi:MULTISPECIES: hypothetical protein [unclassified Sporosarcina]|uniref:hypothetical protein n=1 Tax=unclassified Sporosarcina TaxID=2647733 RepID=UPI00203CACB9|nr:MULTISPECIES: hypothetical protein [unclassified Sporosarcina]GKV64951.1 hypothetical protein NCCP2331_11040 [Sporosarcina sp. NCCP-2331]GLB55061.1 hypothetical protein NCCP2378_08460 [Sporosarcina sp. NCCP-2378]
MNKKWFSIFICSLGVAIGSFFIPPASTEASELVTGTFVKAHYDEIQVDKDTVKDVLSKVTIKNEAGRTITLSIDNYAKLSVDTVPVKIEAFKLGMEIEADVDFRRIKTMNGKTDTPSAVIEENGKVYSGVVSYMERSLKGLTVKLDDGRVKNIYLNADTEVFKKGKLTDIGSLYEGDRVKIKFSEYNSNYITMLEIMEPGVQVAGLYKGTIHSIDPVSKKIIMRDETQFRDWHWFPTKKNSNTSYYYAAQTPIYLDDKPVPHNQLRKYQNHKVYLATVSKHGKEQVERIIIQKNSERTYYEPLKSFNGSQKQITLMNSERFHYHAGTILIRNGRLVEPEALGAYGTAFVAAAGPMNKQYANVIHISNDGLDSPNLADHSIFYGKVSGVLGYQLRLSALKELKNNVWVHSADKDFEFNNETYAVKNTGRVYYDLIPQMDLKFQMDNYGYFYMKGNQVIAAHLTDHHSNLIVSAGRLSAVSPDAKMIDVRNVSQWRNGAWATQGFINKMDIQQATFIKNGAVIHSKDLRINDRLYIVAEDIVKGRMIIVD